MKRLKHIVVFLMPVLVAGLSGCSVAAQIKRADKQYAIGAYYKAGEKYKQVYRKVPTKSKSMRANVAFKQAECYRILNNSKALTAYKNAIKNRYADSVVYLRYAQALQYHGQYKEAVQWYNTYLEGHPDNYVAKAGKYACMQVENWRKQPYRYKVRAMDEFNAKKSSNYAPRFLTADADAVVFTSNRSTREKGSKQKETTSPVTGAPQSQLYTARKNAAGKWEDITLCEGLVSTEEPDAGNEQQSNKPVGRAELGAGCCTSDGKTMYFTLAQCVNGQDIGAKIYKSTRASGEWGEAQEVKLFADSSITVGHPCLNATDDTLYFATDAPGGYGGKDIWFAVSDGSGWTDMQNMGPQINTADDELFPTWKAGRLYFASKGHPGYGGLDLFYAQRADTAWEVYNMGVPFNSNGDDFGICFAGETEDGMFCSNRGQKKGYDLIYSFVLPQMEFLVEGKVTDASGEALSEATLRMVGDDGTIIKTQIHRDGTYKLKLNKDVQYAMLATARGFLNAKQVFDTKGLTDSRTYELDFALAPVSKPVKMGNIFFEFGKWELSPASDAGIEALIQLLQDNPNITIEMAAHTDSVGNDEDNKALSFKRAQTIVNRLIAGGIEAERLTPIGYGEEKPVVVDAALHKQYPYLPVDKALTPAFIATLNAAQQQECNALNRRVEFRVVRTTFRLY